MLVSRKYNWEQDCFSTQLLCFRLQSTEKVTVQICVSFSMIEICLYAKLFTVMLLVSSS